MMGAGADAEDAAQEALLRAWLNSAACRDQSAPLPWMAQIARNEALRIFQRTRRRDERHADCAPESLSKDRAGLEELCERLDVHRALGELAPQDRELLRFRYELDLTQPAIADMLGVPEGTVKVRLHRVRKRLSAMLEQSSGP